MVSRKTPAKATMSTAAPAPRPVTDAELQAARDRLASLKAVIHVGPTERAAYATAAEELGDLEARYAAQQRAALVQGITGELDAAEARLIPSRDRLAAALAAHMDSLAEVLEAADAHNANVATARQMLAEHGLTVRSGAREGMIGSPFDRTDGARIGGTDWVPVVPEMLTAHALRLLFARTCQRSPLADVLKYHFHPHKTADRPDGLVLPGVPAWFSLQAPPPPVLPASASTR